MYFIGKTEMKYLGFWITRDGVKTYKKTGNKKYEATDFPKIST